jgi:hypothetical protein
MFSFTSKENNFVNKRVNVFFILCLFFATPSFRAQTPVPAEKSSTFYYSFLFQVNAYEIDSKLKTGSEILNWIDSIVRIRPNYHRIDSINIYAYTSFDGRWESNMKLSKDRALSIKNYLLDTFHFLEQANLHVEGLGEDWNLFREKVISDENIPSQKQLIEIIDKPYVNYDQKESGIKWLAKGTTYRYLVTNILPSQRRVDVRIIVHYEKDTLLPQSQPEVVVPEIVSPKEIIEEPEPLLPQSQPEVVASEIVSPKEIVEEPKPLLPQSQPEVVASKIVSPEEIVEEPETFFGPFSEQVIHNFWAVKTNLLYWGTGVSNIGVEYPLGDRFSIDFPVVYSPYTIKNNWRIRILGIQPEFRWWFGGQMLGHFAGLHTHLAYYNVSTDNLDRYQDQKGKTPLWGVGLSYGYVLPLKRRWNMEFTIGAGYARLVYDVFYNVSNGMMYDTVSRNYWGLTRAGVTLVYKLDK